MRWGAKWNTPRPDFLMQETVSQYRSWFESLTTNGIA
jgi:hypothetical protein